MTQLDPALWVFEHEACFDRVYARHPHAQCGCYVVPVGLALEFTDHHAEAIRAVQTEIKRKREVAA